MWNLLTLCAVCHNGHHNGKLQIILKELTKDDLIVQFIPKKGWQP